MGVVGAWETGGTERIISGIGTSSAIHFTSGTARVYCDQVYPGRNMLLLALNPVSRLANFRFMQATVTAMWVATG